MTTETEKMFLRIFRDFYNAVGFLFTGCVLSLLTLFGLLYRDEGTNTDSWWIIGLVTLVFLFAGAWKVCDANAKILCLEKEE